MEKFNEGAKISGISGDNRERYEEALANFNKATKALEESDKKMAEVRKHSKREIGSEEEDSPVSSTLDDVDEMIQDAKAYIENFILGNKWLVAELKLYLCKKRDEKEAYKLNEELDALEENIENAGKELENATKKLSDFRVKALGGELKE